MINTDTQRTIKRSSSWAINYPTYNPPETNVPNDQEQQSQIFWGKTSSAFTSSTSSFSSSDFVLLPKVDALLKKEVTVLKAKSVFF